MPSGTPPLWLLACLTLSGTLAMHIFIPALPQAALDLAAGLSTMQLTVSLYIVGLAIGQLAYGPLSDRFGRRPVLTGGLLLYTAASLGAALAPSGEALIVARLLQAFGGCSGLVLGRAIVRDTAGPHDAARRLALMNLVAIAGPGISPLVGSLLADAFGWRSVFVVLAGLGLLGLAVAWRLLPETAPPSANPDLRALRRNYARLIGSRSFLCLALGGGCATTSAYAFLAAAPFIIVEQMHRPPFEVGIYLSILVCGVGFGTLLASRLILRFTMERLLVGGNLISVAGALALLAAVLFLPLSLPLTLLCMLLYTIGAGLASPMALTLSVSVNPSVVGSASGLYGFSQMAVGAVCTAIAGLGRDPALTTAIVLAACSLAAQLSFRIALRARQPT